MCACVMHQGRVCVLNVCCGQVTRAINNEMGKNLGVEMTKLLAPGGDLGKVVAANVEQMAGEMNDRITVRCTTEGDCMSPMHMMYNGMTYTCQQILVLQLVMASHQILAVLWSIPNMIMHVADMLIICVTQSIEAFNNTNNAKVGALESVVAEQAAKVEQSFAMAQEG